MIRTYNVNNVPKVSKHYEASEENSIFLWLKIEHQKPVLGIYQFLSLTPLSPKADYGLFISVLKIK
jgi:hypothetical protein